MLITANDVGGILNSLANIFIVFFFFFFFSEISRGINVIKELFTTRKAEENQNNTELHRRRNI